MTKETTELEIDSLAKGGDGVGRDSDGRVTFVRHTAPGDRVRVRLTEVKKSFARGNVEELLSAGPDRVEPSCAQFVAGTCGGCQWQHLGPASQVAAKQGLVEDALGRAIAKGMSLRPVVTPLETTRWRRRARLHWFRPKGQETALIGFFAPGTRRVAPWVDCEQLTPGLEQAVDTVCRVLAKGLHKRGDISILEGAEGKAHVSLDGPFNSSAAEALAAEPNIAGVRAGRRAFGSAAVPLPDGGHGHADGFEQASVAGNEALRGVVSELAAGCKGKRVLELYAGGGNLTRGLSEMAAQVTAVDTRPEGPELAGVEWLEGDAAEAVGFLAKKGDRFDWVVLDPPRSGAREAVGLLGKVEARNVLYVSCDVATLARDLDVLMAAGFAPKVAVPLDLMPQTAHVEVVVHLARAD